MEIYHVILLAIYSILIKGLFVSIVSIIIAGKIFKTDTRNAFVTIKWIILVHGALTSVYYMIAFAFPSIEDSTAILNRSTGPYWWAYYMMLIPNTVLCLLLFFKKIGRNKYFMLILSVLMNLGWMFETVVIYTTDMQREYTSHLSYNYVWFILLQGLFVGGIIYFIGNLITTRSLKSKAKAFK